MVFFPDNKKDAAQAEDANYKRIEELRGRIRTTDVIKPELDAYIKAQQALLLFEYHNAALEKDAAAKHAEFEGVRNPPQKVSAFGRKVYSPGKYQYYRADQEMDFLVESPKQDEWEELKAAVQTQGWEVRKAYRTWLEKTEKVVYIPTGESTSKESEEARDLYKTAFRLGDEVLAKGDRMAGAVLAAEVERVAAQERKINAIFADPFMKEEKTPPVMQRASAAR